MTSMTGKFPAGPCIRFSSVPLIKHIIPYALTHSQCNLGSVLSLEPLTVPLLPQCSTSVTFLIVPKYDTRSFTSNLEKSVQLPALFFFLM